MRLFAIGDVHGCLAALRRLDEELSFSPEDTVITLGDYVDRGPESAGVIAFLMELRERCRLIPLRGNHEIMMLDARRGRSMAMGWLINGGDATLKSYGSRTAEGVPAAHWEFLESTLPYHEEERDFFVHANADPDLPLSAQPDYTLHWEHLDVASPHISGKRMICGHSAQKSGEPLDLGYAVCIDTHACGGKWLTCLEPATNIYWQANQKGELRRGALV